MQEWGQVHFLKKENGVRFTFHRAFLGSRTSVDGRSFGCGNGVRFTFRGG